MTNDEIKGLALSLLAANSEEEVISIIKEAGLWDNRNLWRLYGDKEGNFAQAGNQQSLPEGALVEKIINSVDARLMAECLTQGIEPESDTAPRSVRDAVAMFFENRRAEDDEAGALATWPAVRRTEESRAITLAATGDRPTRGRRSKNMCLTIVDQGEGQSPLRLPDTILSLNAKNKQRIRFVQGKFNMGGSGALRFCAGGLQLVISKRKPDLAKKENERASALRWGVTVVRREEPSKRSGDPVHSEYTYLAPLGAQDSPRKGDVLSFESDTLPVMPKNDEPYSKKVQWATVVKLYEYETSVGQSNILMKDGLLFALERLMPGIALPIRLHECRGYEGDKERSFETPLAGLVVRLEEGRGDNLEPGFPISVRLCVKDMTMKARIYAFKEDKAATYLKNEGVIFTINGQAHGHLPKTIFGRPKAVGLTRLKDSLLMLVDCSSLSTIQREDLFMSSRDRLSKKPIRTRVEREIEILLRDSKELKRLQQERRAQDVEAKLSEDKPLEEVLGKVLKASPTLKTLFLRGQRLTRPFALGRGSTLEASNGPYGQKKPFKGRRHPTYFKVANHEYGREFQRNCELGRRCRIKFETDVENGYFDRSRDQGSFELEILDFSQEMSSPSFSIPLEDGIAHLNMALPAEARLDDYLVIQATVNDPTLPQPFVNVIRLTVMSKQQRKSGNGKPRKGGGKGKRPSNEGISLPEVITVREGDKYWKKYDFSDSTACHVITDPVDEGGKSRLAHTFYVNLDNRSLKTEMKYSRQDARLLEAKFKYGTVLLGVAMLHDEYASDGQSGSGGKHETESQEDRIRRVTESIAPVLLPIIDQLSGLNEDDLETLSLVGEDE